MLNVRPLPPLCLPCPPKFGTKEDVANQSKIGWKKGRSRRSNEAARALPLPLPTLPGDRGPRHVTARREPRPHSGTIGCRRGKNDQWAEWERDITDELTDDPAG